MATCQQRASALKTARFSRAGSTSASPTRSPMQSLRKELARPARSQSQGRRRRRHTKLEVRLGVGVGACFDELDSRGAFRKSQIRTATNAPASAGAFVSFM